MTRTLFLLGLLAMATPVASQVYRWVDDKGTVHYSNATPPPGVKAIMIQPEAKPGPPSADSTECHTVRCQGERMEERLARREQLETKLAAERTAEAARRPKGLDFRKYVSLQRGMGEGELITIAGAPDLLTYEGWSFKNYIYLPTVGDPFTTTVTLAGGRINRIERIRKF